MAADLACVIPHLIIYPFALYLSVSLGTLKKHQKLTMFKYRWQIVKRMRTEVLKKLRVPSLT